MGPKNAAATFWATIHVVAKACVDALVDGPNISSNDGPGLQKFADHSKDIV